MRRLEIRGPGRAGLGFACLAFLLSLLFVSDAAAQAPSADRYRGPKCFNTVIPNVVATVATVTGARMPGKEIYASGDELFVDIDEGPLVEGQEYLVYRIEGRIRHPRDNSVVGDAVNLRGQVRAIRVEPGRGLVELTAVCGEIEAGDRLHVLLDRDIAEPDEMPDFDEMQLLTPTDADATVVFGFGETLVAEDRRNGNRDAMTERATYMFGEIVTIDQGVDDGWMPGNWGFFYNDQLPVEAAETVRIAGAVAVATGYVVWATESTAALMIVESEGAVSIGLRARPIR